MTWVLVACGGATGALLRYALLVFSAPWLASYWVVLFVNASGSLAIGFFWGWYESRPISAALRDGIVYGLLGAFTTFSAFSWDIAKWIQSGEVARMGLYIMATLVLCTVLARLGYFWGR